MLQRARVDLVLADSGRHGPFVHSGPCQKVNTRYSSHFSDIQSRSQDTVTEESCYNVDEQQITRRARRENILRTATRTRTPRCRDSKHELLFIAAQQTYAERYTEPGTGATEHEYPQPKLGKRHRRTFIPLPPITLPLLVILSFTSMAMLCFTSKRQNRGETYRLTHL